MTNCKEDEIKRGGEILLWRNQRSQSF